MYHGNNITCPTMHCT